MKILFICTGNTCRSAMAEALARAALAEKGMETVIVESAGVCADEGCGMSMGALSALNERGVDGSAHRARMLTADALRDADLVLAMTDAHLRAARSLAPDVNARLLTEYAYGSARNISDPFGGDSSAYEAAADEIARAIDMIIQKMEGCA